jgi:hypothetical protein
MDFLAHQGVLVRPVFEVARLSKLKNRGVLDVLFLRVGRTADMGDQIAVYPPSMMIS